jgi:hypothetical protein
MEVPAIQQHLERCWIETPAFGGLPLAPDPARPLPKVSSINRTDRWFMPFGEMLPTGSLCSRGERPLRL